MIFSSLILRYSSKLYVFCAANGKELVWCSYVSSLYLLRSVKGSHPSLSLSNVFFFLHSFYMLHVFIKPGEVWALLADENFIFFSLIFFVLCVLWKKQNMVLVSDLMNICEMYLSAETEHGGSGEQQY